MKRYSFSYAGMVEDKTGDYVAWDDIGDELEKAKHRTISIECYVTECKHCHEDLYCKNPHGMSVQVCNLGVPQCEGYENSEI